MSQQVQAQFVLNHQPVIVIGMSPSTQECTHPGNKLVPFSTGHFWLGPNGEVRDDVVEHCLCLNCMKEIPYQGSRAWDGDQQQRQPEW